MATLQNLSTRPARWRTFNQGSIGMLVAAAEVDLPPGGSRTCLHPQGQVTAAPPTVRTTPFVPSRHGLGFAKASPRNAPHLTLDIAGHTRGLVDAGSQRAFTIPLGLPLALTHVRVVVEGVGEIFAGYGDDLDIRPNITLMLA